MIMRFFMRRGDAAEWTSVNPVIGEGEAGFETDTGFLKVGDGVTAWNSLGYFSSGGSGVPNGGLTGEVLTKLSNANGDADWEPPTGGTDYAHDPVTVPGTITPGELVWTTAGDIVMARVAA